MLDVKLSNSLQTVRACKSSIRGDPVGILLWRFVVLARSFDERNSSIQFRIVTLDGNVYNGQMDGKIHKHFISVTISRFACGRAIKILILMWWVTSRMLCLLLGNNGDQVSVPVVIVLGALLFSCLVVIIILSAVVGIRKRTYDTSYLHAHNNAQTTTWTLENTLLFIRYNRFNRTAKRSKRK